MITSVCVCAGAGVGAHSQGAEGPHLRDGLGEAHTNVPASSHVPRRPQWDTTGGAWD